MATNSPPPNSSIPAVPPVSTTNPPPPSVTTAPPPSVTTAPPPSDTSSPLPSVTIAPPPADTTASPPPVSTAPPPSNTSPPPRSETAPPPRPDTTPPPSQQSSPPPMDNPATPPPQSNASPPDPTTPSASSPPPQAVVPAAPPPQSPPPPPTQPSNPPTSQPPPPPPTSNSPPPSSSPPPQPPPTNSPPPQPPASAPPPSSPPPPRSTPSAPPPNPPPSPPSDPPASSPPPQPPTTPRNNTPPPPPSVERPRGSPPSQPTPSPPPPSLEPPGNSPPQSNPPESPPAPPAPRSSPSPPSLPPPNAAPPPKTQTPTPPASESSPSPPNITPNSTPVPPTIRPSPPQISAPPPDNTNVNNSSPVAPESSNSSSNNVIGTAGVVAIAVVAGIIVLSLLGFAFWCFRKRRKEDAGVNGGHVMPSPLSSLPMTDSSTTKTQSSAPVIVSGSGSGSVYSPTDPAGLGNSRSFFTYEELVKATNGFSQANLLGKGGFGSVYKGYLPDGREVAIKQLNIGGGQGEREFKAEVEIISRIHHRHLVSLVGYCISENQRLLLYEYVPNNSLYFHLHGEGKPVLEWAARVKIAVGASRGIAYLHEDCHPRIIHRDIKSANILLDNNFDARVSDFGLAKLALDVNSHITTRVMGTFGYMAPEYATSGKLTDKSDVFSFGVVLLELITGRKPVDTSQPVGDESLVEWARPLLSQALENEELDILADPKLGKNYDESEMFRMIEAAAACVRHSGAKRPRMGQVVRSFDDLVASDLSNGMKVGESEIYNIAQQSAEIRWFRRMAFGSQNFSTDFYNTQSSGQSSGENNSGKHGEV